MKVYFIQQGQDGAIKIGVSDNPIRRLEDLQPHSPHPLRLVALIGQAGVPLSLTRGRAFELEAELHKRFQTAHQRGEWFEPTSELLSFIEDDDEVLALLKPCPFCGGRANLTFKESRIDRKYWIARCDMCRVRTDYEYTKAGAIRVWNRREGT